MIGGRGMGSIAVLSAFCAAATTVMADKPSIMFILAVRHSTVPRQALPAAERARTVYVSAVHGPARLVPYLYARLPWPQDDLGYNEMGFMNETRGLISPNLDALAQKDGVILKNY